MPTMPPNSPSSATDEGRRLRVTGKLFFWTGLFGASAALVTRPFLPAWGVMLLVGTFVVVAFVGSADLLRGRKLLVSRSDKAINQDQRPPVVYLRPFAADQEGAGVVSGSWVLLKPTYFTEEEQLAMVLNEIGPFVAIGDPRDALPDLGAARIYVDKQDDWHRTVSDLLSRAALVILRAGTSDGFLWELRLVQGSVAPERLLLLVGTGEAAYEEFRKKAATILSQPLPDLPRRTRVLGRTRAIIAFEANWRAWVLPVVKSFSRTQMGKPYVARVKLTLRPIFERLGVPWSPPRVARGKVIAITVLSVISALFFFLWAALTLPQYFYKPTDMPVAGTVVSEKSAFDKAYERFLSRLKELPEYQDAFKTVTDRDAAYAKGRDISMRGMRRLSDQALLHRIVLLNRIADEADVSNCAAILTGKPTHLELVLPRLSAEEIEQWFDLSFDAIVAELHRTPYASDLSQAQIAGALQQLLARLPTEDSELLTSILAAPDSKTADETCRAARLLLANLLQLPEGPRRILARAFVPP